MNGKWLSALEDRKMIGRRCVSGGVFPPPPTRVRVCVLWLFFMPPRAYGGILCPLRHIWNRINERKKNAYNTNRTCALSSPRFFRGTSFFLFTCTQHTYTYTPRETHTRGTRGNYDAHTADHALTTSGFSSFPDAGSHTRANTRSRSLLPLGSSHTSLLFASTLRDKFCLFFFVRSCSCHQHNTMALS